MRPNRRWSNLWGERRPFLFLHRFSQFLKCERGVPLVSRSFLAVINGLLKRLKCQHCRVIHMIGCFGFMRPPLAAEVMRGMSETGGCTSDLEQLLQIKACQKVLNPHTCLGLGHCDTPRPNSLTFMDRIHHICCKVFFQLWTFGFLQDGSRPGQESSSSAFKS